MKTHRISCFMNNQKKESQSHQWLNPNSSFKQLKQTVLSHFKTKHSLHENIYNIKIVNELICKSSTHIVAQFKDYLLYEDKNEFLQKTYQRSDIKINLPQILEYYNSCSVIFPNYVVLYESKYIFKNIQKKQKVIDYQQKQEMEMENKLNCSLGLVCEDSSSKVFNTQVYDSLLNQTNTSSIQLLLGVQFDDRMISTIEEQDTISKMDNSIEALISHIDESEKNMKSFIEGQTHSSLKKYTSTIKYANCTTTTKDKSSSISNQTCNRKVIICNKISNNKESKIKTNNKNKHDKFPSRPLSNEVSHNTSFNREKLYISFSSKNNFANFNNNKIDKRITAHIKNALSMPKIENLVSNAPITSRERKSKNAMIDLLASRIIKMKSITKKISESESKQNLKQNTKTLHLALSFGVSSLNNKKLFKLKGHLIEKESHNNQKNNNNCNKTKSIGNSAVNLIILNKPLIKQKDQIHIPMANSKTNLSSKKTINKIKSNSKINQFSISPNKQIINNFITKTCTHLPLKNGLLLIDENKKTYGNTLLPLKVKNKDKDAAIKSIQFKGIDYSNKNDSRNDCNTDRIYNKRPSFQKVRYIKFD